MLLCLQLGVLYHTVEQTQTHPGRANRCESRGELNDKALNDCRRIKTDWPAAA